MLLDVLVYLVVFAISAIMAFVFQKVWNKIRINGVSKDNKTVYGILYLVLGYLLLFPIIAMYGLRYGIGTDYFGYERIFNAVHSASLSKYWILHNRDAQFFYIEPGYFFMNKVFPSYRTLLWGIGILMFGIFLFAIKDYSKRISYPFSLFIFLSILFVYSMNAMRFVIALCLIMIGYQSLSKGRNIKFVILILVASFFHKSSLFCLAMVFLKQYKTKSINKMRNILLFVLIITFPLICGYIFKIIGNITLFERYFESSLYSASESMGSGWAWILHVIPVISPLLIFCRTEMFNKEDSTILFRICIMEIPFRMLGLYNTWYTRFARCSQIAYVLFIPLILSKVSNKNKKMLLYVYYVIWFTFYFAYYAIINDQGDSLPYVWVFSR